jgi:hypothetical protein
MRAVPLLVLSVVVMFTAPRALAQQQGGGDPDQQTLNAKDLKKYFAPYIAGVKDCYAANSRDRTATGVLRLELVIRPDGTVNRFSFKAPGIIGAPHRLLDICLRSQSETWHFPVRRGFTTAVLPFQFQITYAPGAGPKASAP